VLMVLGIAVASPLNLFGAKPQARGDPIMLNGPATQAVMCDAIGNNLIYFLDWFWAQTGCTNDPDPEKCAVLAYADYFANADHTGVNREMFEKDIPEQIVYWTLNNLHEMPAYFVAAMESCPPIEGFAYKKFLDCIIAACPLM